MNQTYNLFQILHLATTATAATIRVQNKSSKCEHKTIR